MKKVGLHRAVRGYAVEKDRVRRYAEYLEKIVRKNQDEMEKTVDELRKTCLLTASDKRPSVRVVSLVRQAFREIKAFLAEITAVQRLLQGKYRRYALRNPFRDKKISELGFFAKNLYVRFEQRVKRGTQLLQGKEHDTPDER
jgi:ribosomal protein L15E